WNRSEAQWSDLQFPSATNQSSLTAPLSPLSSRAKPRDLRCAFRTSQIFLPNPNPKHKCHPACPGLPWNRSEAQWSDLLFLSATNQSSLRAPLSPLSSRAKPRDLQCAFRTLQIFL